MENNLVALSNEIAAVVARAGSTVVGVNARERGASSGVCWRPGVIVTAEHTVRRDEEITVALADGRTVPARLAGRDPGTDLAVLQADFGALATPEPAPVDDVHPGQIALVVGRGAETGVSASMGVLSAVAGSWRTWRGGLLDRFLRLDIALYPGSSGGAVVDAQGRVLGLATGALSRTAGMAIPLSTVDRIAQQLLTTGRIARGYLGVGLQPVALPQHLRDSLGLSQPSGVIVLSVEPGGPADQAGVYVGDIFVAIADRPVKDTDDIQAALGSESIGRPLAVSMVRGGARAELIVTPGERVRREG